MTHRPTEKSPGYFSPLYRYRFLLLELQRRTGRTLKGRRVLELGPGKRSILLRYVKNACNANRVLGMGREPRLRLFPRSHFHRRHVVNCFLPSGMYPVPDHSFDLIISRHFFEEYSINPRILLSSPVYWRCIVSNGFHHRGEDFPASRSNLESVFSQAWRVLRPGGWLISQVARRDRSVLTGEFLSRIPFGRVFQWNIGSWSRIISLQKKASPKMPAAGHWVTGRRN